MASSSDNPQTMALPYSSIADPTLPLPAATSSSTPPETITTTSESYTVSTTVTETREDTSSLATTEDAVTDTTATATTLPDGFDKRAAGKTKPLGLFTAPAPLRKLFSYFPLRTYPSEPRPASAVPSVTLAPNQSIQLNLWLRTNANDGRSSGPASAKSPSYDLDCLTYQTYLLARDIKFGVMRACEDASPDRRLPFIIATTRDTATGTRASTTAGGTKAGKLRTSVIRRAEIETFVGLRERKKEREGNRQTGSEEAHTDGCDDIDKPTEALGLSLVATHLRPAFLWALYMTPSNFESIVVRQYVSPAVGASPSSSSPSSSSSLLSTISSTLFSPPPFSLAGALLAREYRAAALYELSTKYLSAAELAAAHTSEEARLRLGDEICRRAGEALSRLGRLLGENKAAEGSTDGRKPGMLDAALFAYAFLLTGGPDGEVDERQQGLQWKDARLGQEVHKSEWLVKHRDWMWKKCYA